MQQIGQYSIMRGGSALNKTKNSVLHETANTEHLRELVPCYRQAFSITTYLAIIVSISFGSYRAKTICYLSLGGYPGIVGI